MCLFRVFVSCLGLAMMSLCCCVQCNAAAMSEEFSLQGIKLVYNTAPKDEGVFVTGTLITRREIISANAAFYTLWSSPANWHSTLSVRGFVDREAIAQPKEFHLSYHAGEVDIERSLYLFDNWNGFNVVQLDLGVSPSLFDWGGFSYEEMAYGGGEKIFLARIEMDGVFDDPAMGRAFAIPEASTFSYVLVSCVCVWAVRVRRRRVYGFGYGQGSE